MYGLWNECCGDIAKIQRYGHWIPACARLTSKKRPPRPLGVAFRFELRTYFSPFAIALINVPFASSPLNSHENAPPSDCAFT